MFRERVLTTAVSLTVSSMVEHQTKNLEAAGSTPAPRSTNQQTLVRPERESVPDPPEGGGNLCGSAVAVTPVDRRGNTPFGPVVRGYRRDAFDGE